MLRISSQTGCSPLVRHVKVALDAGLKRFLSGRLYGEFQPGSNV